VIYFIHKNLFVFFSSGGKKGVFDLEDILEILRDERMKDICVIEIPPEQQYAKYLVLATSFSARHLKSTSEYINKLVRNKIQIKKKFFKKYIV
jgi:ribosomal silencing factor RsfS